jgi:hypothetical protein
MVYKQRLIDHPLIEQHYEHYAFDQFRPSTNSASCAGR